MLIWGCLLAGILIVNANDITGDVLGKTNLHARLNFGNNVPIVPGNGGTGTAMLGQQCNGKNITNK